MPLSTVGSLPNMDSAARTGRASMVVMSSSPMVSRFVTANGSSRPKTIASGSKTSVKMNSPQNIGLLGPVCWRNSQCQGEVGKISCKMFGDHISPLMLIKFRTKRKD